MTTHPETDARAGLVNEARAIAFEIDAIGGWEIEKWGHDGKTINAALDTLDGWRRRIEALADRLAAALQAPRGDGEQPSPIVQLDEAITAIQPLMRQGEDHIWRPAGKAWDAMHAAREALADQVAAPPPPPVAPRSGEEREGMARAIFEIPDDEKCARPNLLAADRALAYLTAHPAQEPWGPGAEEIARVILFEGGVFDSDAEIKANEDHRLVQAAHRAARRILSLSPAPKAGWAPVDSLPTDGREVALWAPGWSGATAREAWPGMLDNWVGPPTMWCDLPAAPAPDASGGGS